ncbi:hypothetical protein FVE85_9506 [Porphyridium purpureum]|uniref:Uncharacterized protein n=1 Tax=Porphyridium purpureum TaxID=35688 RepID=A0A5J4YIE0_PORPP|nr:hypothetical protein FVE85_9506 [Porphyridium purpureum]|eukprot:POR2635..scf261_15
MCHIWVWTMCWMVYRFAHTRSRDSATSETCSGLYVQGGGFLLVEAAPVKSAEDGASPGLIGRVGHGAHRLSSGHSGVMDAAGAGQKPKDFRSVKEADLDTVDKESSVRGDGVDDVTMEDKDTAVNGMNLNADEIDRGSLEALVTVLEAQVHPYSARTAVLEAQLASLRAELEQVQNRTEQMSKELNSQSSRMAVSANAVITLQDQLNETLQNLEDTVEFNAHVRRTLEAKGFDLWLDRHLRKKVPRSAFALIHKSKTVAEKYLNSEAKVLKKATDSSALLARSDPFFRVMLQASFIVVQLVVIGAVLVRVLPLSFSTLTRSSSSRRISVQMAKLYGAMWFALQSFGCLVGSILARCDFLTLWFELHSSIFFVFLIILAPIYISFFSVCVMSASRESRRVNGAVQAAAVFLIGAHFYQGVWIRAVLDLQPTIDPSAYVIYLALFALITKDHCLSLRIDPWMLVSEPWSALGWNSSSTAKESPAMSDPGTLPVTKTTASKSKVRRSKPIETF